MIEFSDSILFRDSSDMYLLEKNNNKEIFLFVWSHLLIS